MHGASNVGGSKLDRFKPLLFILPAFIFYIIFVVVPIINTAYYSFFDWNGANPVMKFIGIDNYSKLLTDELFWKALFHNIIWIVCTVAIPVFLGLILAVLLTSKKIKGILLFRVTYFMPTIVSMVVVSIVWSWIYHPDFGKVNTTLSAIGMENFTRSWLGDENTVLGALVAASSWTYYGFCMVIFMAAIQGIDKTYYEVAMIEGAKPYQTFFRVTIPLLKNTTTLLVLNSLIVSFKVFDIIYIMTKGGPYHSSEVISTYMFTNAFYKNQVGYGAAVALVLALVIALCSAAYLRYAERDD